MALFFEETVLFRHDSDHTNFSCPRKCVFALRPRPISTVIHNKCEACGDYHLKTTGADKEKSRTRSCNFIPCVRDKRHVKTSAEYPDHPDVEWCSGSESNTCSCASQEKEGELRSRVAAPGEVLRAVKFWVTADPFTAVNNNWEYRQSSCLATAQLINQSGHYRPTLLCGWARRSAASAAAHAVGRCVSTVFRRCPSAAVSGAVLARCTVAASWAGLRRSAAASSSFRFLSVSVNFGCLRLLAAAIVYHSVPWSLFAALRPPGQHTAHHFASRVARTVRVCPSSHQLNCVSEPLFLQQLVHPRYNLTVENW